MFKIVNLLILLLLTQALSFYGNSNFEENFNRNKNLKYNNDFRSSPTSQLDLCNKTKVSVVLLDFLLGVYQIKNNKIPHNIDIPKESVEKVKRSNTVQYITLKGYLHGYLLTF